VRDGDLSRRRQHRDQSSTHAGIFRVGFRHVEKFAIRRSHNLVELFGQTKAIPLERWYSVDRPFSRRLARELT
jgi:hypothetical protein